MTNTVRMIPAGTLGADSVASAVTLAPWYDQEDIAFTIAYCEPATNARYGEDIDAAELAWHANTGRGIWLNWEETKLDALEGAAYGRRVGMFLRTMALDLAYPIECPLIFSVDFPIELSPNFPDDYGPDVVQAMETLAAFRKTIAPWPLGVYGPTPIFLAMRDAGWDYYGWRAAAESWGAPVDGTFHVQQHPPEDTPWGQVDRNTVVQPIPMWFPPTDVEWPTLYPYGYHTQEHTAAEIGWRARADLAEPEWWRRWENLMRSRAGRLGVGSSIRSRGGSQPSGASAAGRSFHQIQEFGDGTEWHSAIDAVARNPGGNHIVPPAGLVPRQGTDEAIQYGVHLNVDNPSGGTSSHVVHTQPLPIDGFHSWDTTGRQRPAPDWPLAFDHMPKPPAAQLDPTPPPIPEEIMSDQALIQVPGSGIFGWPSLTPIDAALIDILDLPIAKVSDPDTAWAVMSGVIARLDPGGAKMMRDRYNATTDDVDILEIQHKIPEPGDVEVGVTFPDSITVRVAEMPEQEGSLSVQIDG